MQCLILGAGIIGLNTAYYLQEAGCDVTIIDRQPSAGLETSYANGAQLSYSYVAPLAAPGVMSQVPKWLLDPNSPMKMRPTFKLSEICWGFKFIQACNAQQSAQTTQEMLMLSFLSRSLLEQMIDKEKFAIDLHQPGKLIVHRSKSSFEQAKQQLNLQRNLGCQQEALSVQECLAIEPALAPMANKITGGIYTPSEQAADCYLLCQALEQRLKERGATFLYNTHVKSFKRLANNTVSIITSEGHEHTADHIVVALANESRELLHPLGISLPISPLKGYSLTLAIEKTQAAPTVSVTDFERKVVYARIGQRLRVAGMADRVGMDKSIDLRRTQALIQEAKEMFAEAGDYDKAILWAGLRPATPKGKPILDKTSFHNLWLNVGHGALGFTLANASGQLMAQRITQQTPDISLMPFSYQQS